MASFELIMRQFASRPYGAPDRVFDFFLLVLDEEPARVALVLDYLADDLAEVVDYVFLGKAERDLVGDLKYVAHHVGALSVQAAEGEPSLMVA